MNAPYQRVQVIINPASGGDEPILNTMNDIFNEFDMDWDVSITRKAGDGARFAKLAVEQGVDAVLAYGGDGTQLDVAGGMLNTGIPMGVLPGGAANALADDMNLRRCAVEVIKEVLSVADRCGAAPAAVLGLSADDWAAGGSRAEEAVALFGRANPKGRSSLAADYDRGTQTEIDALLGSVIRMGARHGATTAHCRRVLSLFSERAAGPLPRKPITADMLARIVMGETHDLG